MTARMAVDFRRPVAGRTGRSGPRAGSPSSRRRLVDDRGPDRRRRRPATMLATADAASTSRPPTTASASSRRATASGRLRRRPRHGGRAGDRDRRPPTQRRRPSPRRRASWPSAASRAEALGRAPGRARRRPRRLRRARSAAASPRSPTRTYLDGQQRDRARASGAVYGVRWPLLAAVQRGFRAGDRGAIRPTPLLFVADRLFREPELEARWFAFGLLERTLAERAGADLAAPAPGRPRGRRLDHRRLAGPPVRQGHPARAVPLGRARAARLQPVALGAPARRLDDRDDDPFVDRRPAAIRSVAAPRPRAPRRS